MNAELLRKIRAVAEDPRTQPGLRAAALRKMADALISNPELFADEKPPPPKSKKAPGVEPSEEYARFMFFDTGSWGLTKASGNPTTIVTHNGETRRVVLFAYKKYPGFYGWMLIDPNADDDAKPEFCPHKYATIEAARNGAWERIQRL